YADGQVWIVWQTQSPIPESFVIYKSDNPFTNTNQATPIGRLFHYEYLPGTYIEQTGNQNFTYKIPNHDSIYTLAPGEALFVETVAKSGASYYGVVEWGKNMFSSGINSTEKAIDYNYDPLAEPVTCHLQLSTRLPSGHKTYWYSLWLMGRQDENSGRPDFPVMANVYKNGMPAMFIVSEAITMDTSFGKLIPLTHWLHGGGGNASQHIANKMPFINLAPEIGITASHTDELPQKFITNGDSTFSSGRTQWFGWTRNHNPFNTSFDAGPGDTIINYTQRRILWIHNWLIHHYQVDPTRVALQGYSMGSGGVSALAKAYPNLFSTVSAFNNGFRRVNEETISGILGTVEENLPTNLRNDKNQTVHINETMDMNTVISASRDFPLFRTWAGKTDLNDRMHWGPDLIAQYRVADSLGMGQQINWDERGHTYPSLGFHWIEAESENKQTYLDNLKYQELFNSKQSFPAFFNHRLELKNKLPGQGTFGINNGDGDNWGTWGGHHHWDLTNVIDENNSWSVITWLESNAIFSNDNCPNNSLKSDIAIRKPQQFKPTAGSTLNWFVKDLISGNTLQNGTTIVKQNGVVVLPQIEIFKESIRKVQIVVLDPTVGNNDVEKTNSYKLIIAPNPSAELPSISLISDNDDLILVRLIYQDVNYYSMKTKIYQGFNQIQFTDFGNLPAGIYTIQILSNDSSKSVKWVKIE
ncbi:MAG: hypothetical protein WBO31_13965, partial [Saprospiraceae bacterium]